MAKALDLTGLRFGNLIVLSRAKNNHKGNTQWLCKCDCGNTRIALGYDLTHGRTVTCGCAINKKGKPSSKRESLIGKRFGKLTVVSLNEKRGKRGTLYWNCKCDCGNTHVVSGSNLKTGQVSRCKKCVERPSSIVDITGERFGRLTVLHRVANIKNQVAWHCKCDCGNEVDVIGTYLKSGRKKSCGCMMQERHSTIHLEWAKHNAKKIQEKFGVDPETVTGFSYTRLYREYWSMHSRCKPNYHHSNVYHEKGITVCDEWTGEYGFWQFREWSMQNGYSDSLTLDRIDNDKGYSPNNCRWATMQKQQNNRSDNVFITRDGETKTLKEWCRYYNLDYGMVKGRRQRGWPEERLFEPKHKNQYQ